jgi:hypothetical protein
MGDPANKFFSTGLRALPYWSANSIDCGCLAGTHHEVPLAPLMGIRLGEPSISNLLLPSAAFQV